MRESGPGGPDDGAADGANDILYLVDRLEELVGVGWRMPGMNRVMVKEEDFLLLVDQLRETVPREIHQAQRVIEDRETIISESQLEARRIIDAARQHAEYVVSQQGVLNEARQRAEELLREVETERRQALEKIDAHALEQFSLVDDALQAGLKLIMDAVRQASAEMDVARRNVGR